MSKVRTTVLMAATLCLLAPSLASAATKPHNRTGFFIGIGLGGGSDNEEYKGGGSQSEPGGVGSFRIGGALGADVVLGLESSTFTRAVEFSDGTDARFTASVGTLAVTWFPTHAGFYLRGGLGGAQGRVEFRNGGVRLEGNENGFGTLFAIGNEWRLSDKFALGPQAEFVFLNIGGDIVDTINYGAISAQGTWYW
ncbi:MAG: hypothetical protein DHS20C21_13210 [Gemmatimonadota bacterium]|nr:MAG: hypothetical protein DHS20C21_13210 [Gemmatimonadota bacterium]